jgi:hypothetical protein
MPAKRIAAIRRNSTSSAAIWMRAAENCKPIGAGDNDCIALVVFTGSPTAGALRR